MPESVLVRHIPTISPIVSDGDNKHVLCRCGDLYAWERVWADHVEAEQDREERGEEAY